MDIGTVKKFYLIFPSDYGPYNQFEFRESDTGHFSAMSTSSVVLDLHKFTIFIMENNNYHTYFNSVLWI